MNHLFWVDIETTGLNESLDVLLEVALVVTDREGNVIDWSGGILDHAPGFVAGLMPDRVLQMHTESGLLTNLEESGMSLEETEQKLVEFVDRYTNADHGHKPVLCGSSVHFDRKFLHVYMPKLMERFHYRNLDVSSIREALRNAGATELIDRGGEPAHRALDDILATIDEFKRYRQVLQSGLAAVGEVGPSA